MSEQMDLIIAFLVGKDWTSPTEIGRMYTEYGIREGFLDKWKLYHSSWASPKCKRLVEEGYLERNEKGWYRLKK
jgi:hypothetical protein